MFLVIFSTLWIGKRMFDTCLAYGTFQERQEKLRKVLELVPSQRAKDSVGKKIILRKYNCESKY